MFNQKRTERLFDNCAKDHDLLLIINDLVDFKYKIKYRFWGGPGTYHPKSIQTNTPLNDAFLSEFSKQIQRDEHRAHFTLSWRHGKSVMLHTFIHELYHFHQDALGLLMTPLELDPIIQPDLKSHIKLTLMNEAMAATEAIRASYRLKEAGYPHAWRGAFFSFNWHGLAKNYIKDIMLGTNEEQAAQNLFLKWYESPQRKHYERYAFETYKNHGQEYRNVLIHELINSLAIDKKYSYINKIDYKFKVEYKAVVNNNWQDITIGSPPYLWAKHIK